MLPFLLILVVSMASGFQYSNQALGTETKGSTDTSSNQGSNITNVTPKIIDTKPSKQQETSGHCLSLRSFR